jgi:hypothetical protein
MNVSVVIVEPALPKADPDPRYPVVSNVLV